MNTQIIEPGKYQGYYWKSNTPNPQTLHDEEVPFDLDPTQNPFVIEAQLFDGQISYSVKYVDGRYEVRRWDLSTDFGLDYEYTDKEFVAHPRLKGVTTLCFRQYWKAEADDQCEGMKALRPHALVFVGFKAEEEQQ